MKIKSMNNTNKEKKTNTNKEHENKEKNTDKEKKPIQIKNMKIKKKIQIKRIKIMKILKLYSGIDGKPITDVMLANDFKSRLVGLMFKENIEYPLLFEIPQNMNSRYRSSIHSYFMRHELKLVFIDRNNLIYEIADLKPWRVYIPKKEAKYIIEFDKKKFKNDLIIGDEIEIKQ